MQTTNFDSLAREIRENIIEAVRDSIINDNYESKEIEDVYEEYTDSYTVNFILVGGIEFRWGTWENPNLSTFVWERKIFYSSNTK